MRISCIDDYLADIYGGERRGEPFSSRCECIALFVPSRPLP